MEPSPGKGFRRCFWILEIALHDHIATEHDLAHGLAIGRDRFHCVRVHHRQVFQRVIAHALPRLLRRLRRTIQRVPLRLPVVDHGRAIGFREAIEMGDVEASVCHGGEHGLWRRSSGGEELHLLRQRPLLFLRGTENRRHDDGRTAEMGDLVIIQRRPDRFGPNPT